MSRLPVIVDNKSVEWPFEKISRSDIAQRARYFQRITGENYWWGVNSYTKNNRNWCIPMDERIEKNIIMKFCNLNNASANTARLFYAICGKQGIYNNVKKKSFMIDYNTFMKVAREIQTPQGNFSSSDCFLFYEQRYNKSYSSSKRTKIINSLIDQGLCGRSGLHGNNLTLKKYTTNYVDYAKNNNNNEWKFMDFSGIKSCKFCTYDNNCNNMKCEICGLPL